MLVNLIQYRGTVGVFSNQNFSFNYKSNFKGLINRMAISYAVLNNKNFSIVNIIQIFLILFSVFFSLNYKYCIFGRHLFLYIFILTSILVVLPLWSHSNILLSILLFIKIISLVIFPI